MYCKGNCLSGQCEWCDASLKEQQNIRNSFDKAEEKWEKLFQNSFKDERFINDKSKNI